MLIFYRRSEMFFARNRVGKDNTGRKIFRPYSKTLLLNHVACVFVAALRNTRDGARSVSTV